MNNPELTDPAAARSGAAPQLTELDELKARIERASWPNQPGGLPVVYVGDLLDWLDESLAALAAARLACHQQIAVCHDVLSAVNASVDLSLDEAVQAKVDALLVDCEHEACITWNRLAERADAAEAARTALRHELLALPRYQAGEFIIGGRRPHPDGEFVKWNDLTDRLARDIATTKKSE